MQKELKKKMGRKIEVDIDILLQLLEKPESMPITSYDIFEIMQDCTLQDIDNCIRTKYYGRTPEYAKGIKRALVVLYKDYIGEQLASALIEKETKVLRSPI